jgi:hypothetical protein
MSPYWFLFYGLCRPEPVQIGLYELVLDDDVSLKAGRTRLTISHIDQQEPLSFAPQSLQTRRPAGYGGK